MPDEPPPADPRPRFAPLADSTLRLALVGSLLMWLAQPPAMLGWLGWVAPAPWAVLIARERLSGRRVWLKLWLAGAAYWAAAVYWIALPHPLTPIGLVFLAGYLGCYLPGFVALSRVGVHRLRAPLWLAAPVVWTGLEWIQSHLFSGFLMGALSHSQAWYPDVIQIAEWTGAYGVSFALVMTAAALVDLTLRWRARRGGATVPIDRRPPAAVFAAALPPALMLFVGHWSLQAADQRSQPGPTVALIQGDTRATWDPNPDRATRIMQRHRALSLEAVEQATTAGEPIDLLVWPESMFMTMLVTVNGDTDLPNRPEQSALIDLRLLAGDVRCPVLVGISRLESPTLEPGQTELDISECEGYNAAVLADKRGRLQQRYDKVHRVPFGEYIPLFEDWQAMAYLTPMPGGTRPGAGPVAMPIETRDGNQIVVSPSICYETVIPHVIRRQVAQLQDESTPPDLLVNVTNNAWFWGSSELEMHLACNLFRCVENRTPMVVAANGGLSAVVDSAGRVLEVSGRMTEQVILADVPLDPRVGFYTRHGDLLAWACLIACAALAIIGVTKNRASETRPSGGR